jgi:transcription initiation factor IIE alpha subunit
MEDYAVIPERLWKLTSLNKTEQFLILSLSYCHQTNVKTSRKSLARISGRSLSAVRKALNGPESLGLITQHTRKHEDGGHLSSTYIINDEAVEAALQELS